MSPISDLKAQFGKKLREMRQAREIGLREFARRIDIAAPYLSNIERGVVGPPSAEIVIRIAEELDEDPQEMLELARRIDVRAKLSEKRLKKGSKRAKKILGMAESILQSEDAVLSFTDLMGLIVLECATPGKTLSSFEVARFVAEVYREIAENDDSIPPELEEKRKIGSAIMSAIFGLADSDALTSDERANEELGPFVYKLADMLGVDTSELDKAEKQRAEDGSEEHERT